ncbi:MAG: hypothetical protein H6828_11490 [Planctomycetes bacterium]|nr:hypothetical protein [Planctomycetota bacterium]
MTLRTTLLAPILLAAALGTSPTSAAAFLAPATQGSAETLTQRRDAWLAQQGLTLGSNANGTWIGYGSVTLDSAPGPAWGAARLAGFEHAEAEARASFVELMGVQVTTESVARLFQDDGAFQDLLDPHKRHGDALAGVLKKLGELEGEDLVRALELLGLDAEALAKASEPERRVALSQGFQSRVATRAARALRGLRVAQTFEASGESTHSVGVLVSWSERNAKLAQVVVSGKGTVAAKGEGKPLAEWLPSDDAALLHDWGVRVFPGPEGEPLVVAFGQAVVNSNPGDATRARELQRRTALMRAKAFALRDLTQFVNATTLVDQVTTRGESYEAATTLFPDGFVDHDPGSSSLANTLDRTIETRGQAVIVGGEEVRSWTATLPGTDVEFCGVVYAWSPTRARLAYDFAKGKGPGEGGEGAGEEKEGNDYPVDF